MKRAQITIFLIVGIVILFIMGFGIYMLSSLQQEVSIEKPDGISGIYATARNAAESTLEATAQQGGVTLTKTINNTQIVLLKTTDNFTEEPTPYFISDHEYGTLAFDPLCAARGPNQPNASQDNGNSCLPGTYQLFETNDAVIQHVLAKRIAAALANQSLYANVSVLFGGNDVVVRLDNLTVLVPVRFKRLYNAALYLAYHDSQDLLYDKRNTNTIPGCVETKTANNCWMSGMTVSVAFEPTQQASIVTLADANGAKPFIYQFAIENRRPVMYYGGYTDTLNARNPHYVEAQQTLAAKMVRGPLVSSPGICDPLATDPQARRECADVCYQTNPWHLNMAGALLPISINVTDPDDEITDEALGIKQLQPTCEIVHDDAYTSIPWEQTDIDGAFVNVIGCTPSIESIDAPAGNIIHELRLQTMATCSPALKSASRPFTFKVAVYDAAGASYDTTFLGKVTDPLTGCFVVNGPHPRNGAAVYGACCSGPNAPKLIRQGNQCCKGSKEAIDDPTFCAACSEEGAAPTPRGGCCTGFTAYEHPCQGWICIPDNEAMACDLSDSACGGGCRGFDSRDQDPDPAITDMQCVQIC